MIRKMSIIGNAEQTKQDRIRCRLDMSVLYETVRYNIELKKSTIYPTLLSQLKRLWYFQFLS